MNVFWCEMNDLRGEMNLLRCEINVFQCEINLFGGWINVLRHEMNLFRCWMNVFQREINDLGSWIKLFLKVPGDFLSLQRKPNPWKRHPDTWTQAGWLLVDWVARQQNPTNPQ